MEREERKLLAKLTWQATSRDVLNVMGGKDDVYTDNLGLTSFDTPETGYSQRSPSFFYNPSWQRTWNPSNLLEVRVTGYDAEDIRNPRFRDVPAVRILGGNSEQFQNAVSQRDYLPTSRGVAAQRDSYLSTGPLRHHLRVGGDYTVGWWEERRTRNAGFTWRPERADDVAFDPGDPATWGFISSDWGGDINLDTRTVNAAVYVQDDIDVGSRRASTPGCGWGTGAATSPPATGAATSPGRSPPPGSTRGWGWCST